jgi:hypothetical protein
VGHLSERSGPPASDTVARVAEEIDDAELEAVLRWLSGGDRPDRAVLRSAVKESLAALAAAAPGHSVEVRVPPFGAVQCITGPRHGRGNPPNVVEADPRTWLALVTGRMSWADALRSGRLTASGTRADEVARLLPLT